MTIWTETEAPGTFDEPGSCDRCGTNIGWYDCGDPQQPGFRQAWTNGTETTCEACTDDPTPLGGEPLAPWGDDKIAEVARGVVTGELWLAWAGTPAFTDSFGMLLTLADPATLPPNAVGMFAKIAEAGPRAVNGAPVFWSGEFVPEETAHRLHDKIVAMLAALEGRL
jgi:hypothetical protein